MSHPTLAHLQDRFSAAAEAAIPDVDLTFRSMFGGILPYIDGRACASLSDVGLGLKLSPKDQIQLLAEDGAKRLRYEPDAPESKQYIVVPDNFLSDTSRLAPWVKLSLEFARTLPPPKKKAKTPD